MVTLPDGFSNQKQVTIYVDDHVDLRFQKLEALKMAANDPLFLADIEEVEQDFTSTDHEIG